MNLPEGDGVNKAKAAEHLERARKEMVAADYRFAIGWLYHAIAELIGADEPDVSEHGAGIQRTHPAAEKSVVDAPAVASSMPPVREWIKAYTHWPKGTPLVESSGTWWHHYRAGTGSVVTLVVAEDPDPRAPYGHPVMLWADRIPQSIVRDDGSVEPVVLR